MKAKFTESSGNIFADLGFAAEESLAYRLRSELMIELKRQILSREMNQVAAAKWLGVSQPRISDLLRSQFDKFSVDGLITMLGRAGLHVALRVEEAKVCAPIEREFDLELPAGFLEKTREVWRTDVTVGPRQPMAPVYAEQAA